MITDITYLGLDNTEKITLRFADWDILFHTLYTEQFVSTLLNIYNSLSIFIPDDQRATIQVNPSALSHSSVSEGKPKPVIHGDNREYANALKTMYHILCNKYATKPLEDIENELCDCVENQNKSILIDSSKRLMDAQQCAAIIEVLHWDR